MPRTKIILFLVVVIIILIGAVFFYGRSQGRKSIALTDNSANVVNSQIILDRITDQYFLVTKTIFANSNVEIETPKNDDWRDLFLGKKITVRGVVRVDVGVDAKNLRLENIEIDNRRKTVTITLPPAEILDSSLYGQLDIVEDKAIVERLKGFLTDTRNEDYNSALQTLITNAEEQVRADQNIFVEARAASANLIEVIVASMLKDYQVIIK